MNTDTKNKSKKQLPRKQSKLSRLSFAGIFAFLMICTFFTMIMLMFSKTNDFPVNTDVINVKQCWTRGEYSKLYSYFINEIDKFKYWQAYQAALKLEELDKNNSLFLDDENIQVNADIKRLVEIVAQSVPNDFKNFAEKRIEFQSVIKSIKKQFIILCPNLRQAEAQLGSENIDIEIIKRIPRWVFASGFEAEIAVNTRLFPDYIEFLKLRMHGDFKKDTMHDITELIDRFQYSFKHFMSRSIIRNFGRKLVGMPEIYTFAEKERKISLNEKIEALHVLFEFIRDNVAIVSADRSYVPTYPLDTLYRGYGGIKSVNYLFSDLVSAVLDINSFEISFTDSDARPLMCLLFDEKQGRHYLFGFDFVNSIPLLNSQGELLDIIDFYNGAESAEPLIIENCSYLNEIRQGGKFKPKYFGNLFQFESSISLYLNNDIDIDIRPLPSERNLYRNKVLLPSTDNYPNVQNFLELSEILVVWGDILPSKLPIMLLELTSKKNRTKYFNMLLNSKAKNVNMHARKKLLIHGWHEDVNTDFSAAETDYFTEEHYWKHIKQNWIMLLNGIDNTSAMLPFQGSAALFGHILIENYRQFKISAVQALFQSGLLHYNSILTASHSSTSVSANAEKASVYFSDFIKKVEFENEIQFCDDIFPGALIAQARYLLAKCSTLTGKNEKAVEMLKKMVDDDCKPVASMIALKYGFNSVSKHKNQTRKK
ncbi:MAG: hypothetical protein K8S87_03035 [Planctomycetes bacterium]|nr:hypothetical protein [Planctomycetota bacterium]